MSSLATLAELPDISYYNDWDSVKQSLQNWSVRDKFTYRTPCKDDRRARYVCTQQGCRFRVTGNKDRSGRITVKVVNREHTCVRQDSEGNAPDRLHEEQENPVPGQQGNGNGEIDAQKDPKYRNPATQMKWLVTAIGRVLDVTIDTKPHHIQEAAKEYYNEEISYQQAFRCLRHLTADIKEQGHRERVPDELRKAIVTLRVFVDPPMDWTEIERKTGIKARTAGYIFTSAEKKSGGSKDPFVLLKNATITTSGPKAGEKTPKTSKTHARNSHSLGAQDFNSADIPAYDDQLQPRKRRKRDEMIDPDLDVTVELARAAAEVEDDDGRHAHNHGQGGFQDEEHSGDEDELIAGTARLPNVLPPLRRTGKQPAHNFSNHGAGVEERMINALGGHNRIEHP